MVEFWGGFGVVLGSLLGGMIFIGREQSTTVPGGGEVWQRWGHHGELGALIGYLGLRRVKQMRGVHLCR